MGESKGSRQGAGFGPPRLTTIEGDKDENDDCSRAYLGGRDDGGYGS